MVHRQRYCLGDKLSTLRAKNIPTFTNVTMLIPYSKQACLLLVLYCFLVGQYISTVSIVCRRGVGNVEVWRHDDLLTELKV